jgi:hypothetical protein
VHGTIEGGNWAAYMMNDGDDELLMNYQKNLIIFMAVWFVNNLMRFLFNEKNTSSSRRRNVENSTAFLYFTRHVTRGTKQSIKPYKKYEIINYEKLTCETGALSLLSSEVPTS